MQRQADEAVPLWVNKNLISMARLEDEINQLRSEEGGDAITSVIIRSDVSVPSGTEKEVINRVIKLGLKCGLVGKPMGQGR